jgi:hypothetical protein
MNVYFAETVWSHCEFEVMTVQNDTPLERVVRMDDYFAEQFEQKADMLPPSMADKAAILRERAVKYRTSDNTKMLTIRYHWVRSDGDVEEDVAGRVTAGVPEDLAGGQDEVGWRAGDQVAHGLLRAKTADATVGLG